MSIDAHICGLNGRIAVVTPAGALAVAAVGSRQIAGRYAAASLFVAGSASAQNVMSIECPVSATRQLYLNWATVRGSTTAQSSVAFLYRVSRAAAMPSGGTPVTPQKTRTNVNPSVAVLRASPTATAAAGDIWTGWNGPFTSGIIPLALPDSIDSRDESDDVVLAPGEALLFWADANATTFKHWVNLRWQEGTDGL